MILRHLPTSITKYVVRLAPLCSCRFGKCNARPPIGNSDDNPLPRLVTTPNRLTAECCETPVRDKPLISQLENAVLVKAMKGFPDRHEFNGRRSEMKLLCRHHAPVDRG